MHCSIEVETHKKLPVIPRYKASIWLYCNTFDLLKSVGKYLITLNTKTILSKYVNIKKKKLLYQLSRMCKYCSDDQLKQSLHKM